MDLENPPLKYNKDFTEAIYPYVENSVYIYLFLCLLLVPLIYFKPKISKSLLYLHLLLDLPRNCLPRLIEQGLLNESNMQYLLLGFCVFHFDFWPSFIVSILYVACDSAIMAVVYEIPIDGSFILSFLF